VLNDCLGESGLRVRSGQFFEGYALGSTKTKSQAVIHGSLLEGEFSVLDGMGREFAGEVQFLVDRRAQPIRRGRSVRPGEGLYAPNELPLQWDSVPPGGDPCRCRVDHPADEPKAGPARYLKMVSACYCLQSSMSHCRSLG
jgi:hypothetical protein